LVGNEVVAECKITIISVTCWFIETASINIFAALQRILFDVMKKILETTTFLESVYCSVKTQAILCCLPVNPLLYFTLS
jgi:hypothetical protein